MPRFKMRRKWDTTRRQWHWQKLPRKNFGAVDDFLMAGRYCYWTTWGSDPTMRLPSSLYRQQPVEIAHFHTNDSGLTVNANEIKWWTLTCTKIWEQVLVELITIFYQKCSPLSIDFLFACSLCQCPHWHHLPSTKIKYTRNLCLCYTKHYYLMRKVPYVQFHICRTNKKTKTNKQKSNDKSWSNQRRKKSFHEKTKPKEIQKRRLPNISWVTARV